jgi:hypothetical protein
MYFRMDDYKDNPFKPQPKSQFSFFDTSQKFKDQERMRKWNLYKEQFFPELTPDFEAKRKFVTMTLDELAEYFYDKQEEFEKFQDFLFTRCNAEHDGGYGTLCFKIRLMQSTGKTKLDIKA